MNALIFKHPASAASFSQIALHSQVILFSSPEMWQWLAQVLRDPLEILYIKYEIFGLLACFPIYKHKPAFRSAQKFNPFLWIQLVAFFRLTDRWRT